MTTEIDITTDSLRSKGFDVRNVGKQIVIKEDGSNMPWLVDFDKNKISASSKKVQKKLEEEGIDRLIISEILSAIASRYQDLMGRGTTTATTSSTAATARGPKMAPKAIRADCSMDEWRLRLQEKYNDLKTVTNTQIPGLWMPLEFAISVRCIQNIRSIKLPFIGIILGPPGSLKSVAIDAQKRSRDTFDTDNFSPKAFVSHNSNLTEEELQQQDLLPKIKNRLFLVPELAPLFSVKDDELASVIGIVTRIADGNGYYSDSGSKGHRGYPGPLMFLWLGAAVDIPYKVHKILSILGPKLYFLRLPMSVRDEDDILHSMKQDNFMERLAKVQTTLFEYLEYLESCPDMQVDPESGIPKVQWDAEDPRQEQAQRYIIYLAELLAYLRGTVSTWKTEDTQGLDYAYTSRNVENPERAITELHNLAKGHALSQGRDRINIDDDLPLITKVVLSGAASIERVKVLNALLDKPDGGYMTVQELMDVINTSSTTAKKSMAELKSLGLVDIITLGEGDNAMLQMRLKDNFEWFYGQEFKKLKGGYTPGDFKNYLVNKKKNKDTIEQGEGGLL